MFALQARFLSEFGRFFCQLLRGVKILSTEFNNFAIMYLIIFILFSHKLKQKYIHYKRILNSHETHVFEYISSTDKEKFLQSLSLLGEADVVKYIIIMLIQNSCL